MTSKSYSPPAAAAAAAAAAAVGRAAVATVTAQATSASSIKQLPVAYSYPATVAARCPASARCQAPSLNSSTAQRVMAIPANIREQQPHHSRHRQRAQKMPAHDISCQEHL